MDLRFWRRPPSKSGYVLFVNSLIYEGNRLLHRGGAMTLFFKGVWEFGQLKGTCCGGLGYVSCRRGRSSFWHDREAEESHAGEGKVALGMTGEQGKVMPEREK